MRLAELTDENRRFIAKLLSLQWTLTAAVRQFYAQFPDAQEYDYRTFLAWKNSSQGVEEIRAARGEIQEQVKETPFVHRAERLAVLQEVATALLERIRKVYEMEGLGTSELVSLSGELRSLMREIREEATPYDVSAGASASPFAEFMAQFAQQPKELRAFIAGDEATKEIPVV